MQSIRQLLGLSNKGLGVGIPLRTQSESPTAMRSKCRIEVLQAINGRVLEVATRDNTNHDWDVELYIVQPNESLADALATVLVLKGGM